MGAAVLAAPLATATVTSPATTLTSLGMRDSFTILAARAAGPSSLRRRARPITIAYLEHSLQIVPIYTEGSVVSIPRPISSVRHKDRGEAKAE